MNSPALVPVSIVSSTTGRPSRFALICAPTDEDRNATAAAAKLPKGEKSMQIVEQSRARALKSATDKAGEEEDEAKPSKDGLEDFISLDIHAKEKLVPLDSIFPDKELIR
ncbi:unnamed protein product [Gongylonema pulchrum]|uniref:POP1 C-terminal domain-containing protein n=1 Tax=Gongylonema pulchrum TaxID=637853 RepID=A0A3P7NTD0_9BILA|nr:unnamed protein product [Gongylonema pulchrum]